MRVLILGGYGTFGGRLAELLVDEPALTLIITGRSEARAREFCRRLTGRVRCLGAVLDRNGDLDTAFSALRPDLVVDATGPFQTDGDEPYRVVKACLAHRIDYMDLADGARFVAGIGQFDDEARAHGIFVLSGVSTCPVLTAAAVRDLAQGLARLDAVDAGISPSPYADVGPNVVQAIAAYAGRPITLRRNGTEMTAYALIESMRFTIAPPGCVPLKNTRFSLVEVSDIELLPALWPELRSVWFGAGPTPEILHRALSGFAWLVRLGVLRSLTPLAPLFHRAAKFVRWGEHRGGMFVRVRGRTADGVEVCRSWHLIAEGDDGPFIPSMAASAIIRRILAGRRPESGARPATHELELADYQPMFVTRRIRTGRREETAPSERHSPG